MNMTSISDFDNILNNGFTIKLVCEFEGDNIELEPFFKGEISKKQNLPFICKCFDCDSPKIIQYSEPELIFLINAIVRNLSNSPGTIEEYCGLKDFEFDRFNEMFTKNETNPGLYYTINCKLYNEMIVSKKDNEIIINYNRSYANVNGNILSTDIAIGKTFAEAVKKII